MELIQVQHGFQIIEFKKLHLYLQQLRALSRKVYIRILYFQDMPKIKDLYVTKTNKQYLRWKNCFGQVSNKLKNKQNQPQNSSMIFKSTKNIFFGAFHLFSAKRAILEA